MKINAISDFFKNLINETEEKSEIKVYKKFIAILSDLNNKDLTEKQLKLIEDELETLNLNPPDRKKYFKLKFTQFTKFLKHKLSMISEGYYTSIGIGLGLSFGVAFGAAFENVSFGLIFGMLIGLVIGVSLDSKAKKEGKVLKTKLN